MRIKMIVPSILVMVLVSSCSQSLPKITSFLAYDQDFAPTSLRIKVDNPNKEPICIPISNVNSESEGNSLYLNGKQIFSVISHNKQIISLKGIDISDGIYIVPQGSRIFWLELSVFPISTGSYKFNLQLPYFNCADLFGNTNKPKVNETKASLLFRYTKG